MKPFTAEDVHRALALAEDNHRGRESLRMNLPRNLRVYDEPDQTVEIYGFIPSKPSLRTRFGHWITAQQRP
jgi:hypothetical protein